MKKINIKIAILMKQFIYTVIVSAFGIQMAKAQSEIEIPNSVIQIGKVTFGVKAGYTQSNLYGSEIDYIFADNKTTSLPSFQLGIVVNSQVGKYFWLKHELLLNQRGAGVSLTDSVNGDYTSKLKMLYVDLFPISPTFHFKGFQIYAGPYVSLLADASIKRKDESGNYFNDTSIFGDAGNNESKSKYLQKFDFGLNAGIEYQFPFGLLIGAKYTLGFTDIFQYSNSYTLGDSKVDDIKIYNRALMFSLGYSFIGKSKNKMRK